MFKNKQKGGLWSIILAAILLCVGAIIGVEAAISLINGGEGGIKLLSCLNGDLSGGISLLRGATVSKRHSGASRFL